MRKTILCASLLAFALLLGSFAQPAAAIPRSCSAKCQPSTPDYIACTCPFSSPPNVVNCGEYRAGECGFTLTAFAAELEPQLLEATNPECANSTETAPEQPSPEPSPTR